MRYRLYFLCFCLLLSVLLVPSIWGAPQPTISDEELQKLIEISKKLEALNTKLQAELKSSKQSLAELSSTVENLRNEAELLRNELEQSRLISAELLKRAELSETESKMLRESLRKTEESLTNLEKSFQKYNQEVKSKIRSLTLQRNIAVIGAAVAVLVAIIR